jgi:hypothetical protein
MMSRFREPDFIAMVQSRETPSMLFSHPFGRSRPVAEPNDMSAIRFDDRSPRTTQILGALGILDL